MNLADLHETTPRPPRAICTVARILNTLEPADAAWLADALEDEEETGAAIGRTLTRAGHKIAGTTIARHRRGDCTC